MAFKDHPYIIVATIVIAVSAVAGLFWNIGYSMRGDRIQELETKIETYKLAESIEAQKLLTALQEASKELKSNLQIITEVSMLRKENKTLTDKNQDLAEALRSVKDESNRKIAELTEEKKNIQSQLEKEKAALAELFLHNEEFTLDRGQSKTFGMYDVVVGYVGLNSESSIKVVFDNKESIMTPGTVLATQINGRKCKLILERFEFSKSGEPANFRFTVNGK